MNNRLNYARLFFFGKKSDSMLSIERRYPEIEGFDRTSAFFHAFGNIDLFCNEGNFLIFLPARHTLAYQNTDNAFYLSCGLFSLYLTKKKYQTQETKRFS